VFCKRITSTASKNIAFKAVMRLHDIPAAPRLPPLLLQTKISLDALSSHNDLAARIVGMPLQSVA
jgi:hypothetical protein